jgi:hypothetical protein
MPLSVDFSQLLSQALFNEYPSEIGQGARHQHNRGDFRVCEPLFCHRDRRSGENINPGLAVPTTAI